MSGPAPLVLPGEADFAGGSAAVDVECGAVFVVGVVRAAGAVPFEAGDVVRRRCALDAGRVEVRGVCFRVDLLADGGGGVRR